MIDNASRDLTDLLVAWRHGDEAALSELMPQVYSQLSQIAGHLLRHEWHHKPFDTSALVHEAYLRLIDLDRISWQSRAHFFAMSSRVMRRVLVDEARRQRRDKRGAGQVVRLETAELRVVPDGASPDLVEVDEALRELARHDLQLAQIVELRFFGGLGREEIATVLSLSSSTVTRRWYAARAWLLRYLSKVDA